MKRPLLIHPWLFALYPTLFVYAHNIQEVSLGETVLPALVSLAGAALIALVAWPALKTREKVGLAVTLAVIYVFAYGHIEGGLRDAGICLRRRWLIPGWTALLVAGLYFTRRASRSLAPVTRAVNLAAVCLVGISVAQIGVHAVSRALGEPRTAAGVDEADTAPLPASVEELPDIYYIVPDRYPRADVLRGVFGYDNSPFLDFLARKGFYIASDSFANYPLTDKSLASSLNMVHLTGPRRHGSDDVVEWRDTYPMMQRHRIATFLKRRGYRFIHFGTGWKGTQRNGYADENVSLWRYLEVPGVIYDKTIFSPLLFHFFRFDRRWVQWRRVLHQFEMLRRPPQQGRPTFAFVHILCPHPPFVFDADGSFLSQEAESALSRTERHNRQLGFLNTKLQELIETILKNARVPPIIVLQSDEGPYSASFGQSAFCDCAELSDAELWEKMAILNAYYLPGFPREKLYPGITPVNSFRLIFNHYFGTNYPLLPDECYGWTGRGASLRYLNITQRLRRRASPEAER